MRLRYFIITILCIVFAQEFTFAQPKDTLIKDNTKISLKVPRVQMKPKTDFIGIPAIDTIDTQTPGIKIVIYANNTWNFYKDHSKEITKDLYTKYWDSEFPDPYRAKKDNLPDRITLMLLDSMERFVCPYTTKVYSPFGYRHRRRHNGVDLPLKTGTPVYAAFDGKVRMSKYYKGFGNLVLVRHPSGLETFYAHLSKRLVNVGDWVEAGQEIGLGGSTGRSTGPHLHFETRYNGYAFDPQWIIDFQEGKLRSNLFVLKKKYLDAGSKYIPDSDDVENDINDGDTKAYALAREKFVADSIAQAKLPNAKLNADNTEAKYYRVKQGDNLGKIAIKNKTTITKLLKLNPGLTRTTTLKLGRNIRVR